MRIAVIILLFGSLVFGGCQTGQYAVFKKKNPYRIKQKSKDNNNFHLRETKRIIRQNEKKRDEEKRSQLEKRKKDIDQELEAVEAAEDEKEVIKKVNSGKFLFY